MCWWVAAAPKSNATLIEACGHEGKAAEAAASMKVLERYSLFARANAARSSMSFGGLLNT